jgi:hypothetical protein
MENLWACPVAQRFAVSYLPKSNFMRAIRPSALAAGAWTDFDGVVSTGILLDIQLVGCEYHLYGCYP